MDTEEMETGFNLSGLILVAGLLKGDTLDTMPSRVHRGQ